MARGAVRVSNSTIAAEPADTLQSVYARTYARVLGYYPPPTLHESPPLRNHGKAIKGWDKGHDVVSMA